ncbi:hypothetical protein ACB098_01G163100 [Castanea mollissima]
MEKLISGRCHLQLTQVPLCETIPVIDLEGELSFDRAHLIKQIIQASQEFGLFQKLVHDVIDVGKEFFELPAKDKVSLYSEDPKQSCRLFTSIDYDSEKVHYWRDALRHLCHPLEEHMQFWPEKPPHYREVVGNYSAEVWKLSLWVLDLICEGLGLESRYLREELSPVQSMAINHYPPCPDKTFFKIYIFSEITSNWKLSSADHRVVTNKEVARTTVTSFIHPCNNCRIETAKVLLSDCAVLHSTGILSDTHNRVPPLEAYKIQN